LEASKEQSSKCDRLTEEKSKKKKQNKLVKRDEGLGGGEAVQKKFESRVFDLDGGTWEERRAKGGIKKVREENRETLTMGQRRYMGPEETIPQGEKATNLFRGDFKREHSPTRRELFWR